MTRIIVKSNEKWGSKNNYIDVTGWCIRRKGKGDTLLNFRGATQYRAPAQELVRNGSKGK